MTGHDYDKYVTLSKVNKLTAENFTARLKQASLVNKSGIPNFEIN